MTNKYYWIGTLTLTSCLISTAANAAVTYIGSTGAAGYDDTVSIKGVSGVKSGDLIFVDIEGNQTQSTITPPSGFALVDVSGKSASITTPNTSYVYVKTAGSSEPTSYTFQTDSYIWAASLVDIRGAQVATALSESSSSWGTSPGDLSVEAQAQGILIYFIDTPSDYSAVVPSGMTMNSSLASSESGSQYSRSFVMTEPVTVTGSLSVNGSITQASIVSAHLIAVSASSGGTTPAPVVTLSANPTSIKSGASSTLSWSSTNATSCTGSGGTLAGALAISGSKSVTPTATTSYTVTCIGAGGSGAKSVTVSVGTVTPAPTVALSASPTSIASGASSTLSWSSTNATTCTASGGTFTGTIATSGSRSVSPTASTTYSVSCSGAGGSAAQSVQVVVTTVSGSGGCTGGNQVLAYSNGEGPGWGDFDNGATTNYADTSGAPPVGTYDAKTTTSEAYGEWLFHSPCYNSSCSATGTTPQYGVNITGCNFMYISLKNGEYPANWQIYAVLDFPADSNTGVSAFDISSVEVGSQANGWVQYKIPLYPTINGVNYVDHFFTSPSQTLLPSGQNTFYKFGLQDQSGHTSNYWYGSQVYFTAE